ncbi:MULTISPECIES: hypothetical protein [Acidobacterium]|uniref:Putative membrane protein n=1 Tax=Acidobacterium capsulatum (strain ATCC 51196 / DSM 11244 / BCRC 80197 / JCM 7670 / NBRC 15755 / NCIMB 13165 / 161) TaxID=240015 RepID=C1F4U7_ACIC5|nr:MULTISPECIES: hypothetical protein [Acidobacterium]ACO34149.1 putative membrane protein [Acidobacterium capsulatum ATCC 51196]HCT59514.1 hypothetical protein [Acidobacterium sp.]
MRKGWPTLILAGISLALASVGPLIFPIAESGTSSLSALALHWMVPAIVLLAIIAIATRKRLPLISHSIFWGALAGMVATVGLECIRISGFHLGYMPGSMPKLIGVLLLDQFMTGPTVLSNIAGWAYHFWNGACFGIVYVLFLGTRRRWLAIPYALVIGTIFMLSPVVRAMGIGYFGLQFSVGFLIVVYLAHLVFGSILGWLSRRLLQAQPSAVWQAARLIFRKTSDEQQPSEYPRATK